MSEPTEFKEKLSALLNVMSQENESNTPDFILAEYLLRSLQAFNVAVVHREKWYGRAPQEVDVCPSEGKSEVEE
jgi:hypothetical protein